MRNELTKYNIDKALKALEEIKGKDIMLNETCLYDVASIEIEESEMYDSDPDPSINYDGGKRDLIILRFSFENGKAVYSYCPDEQVCHYWDETPDLLCFRIESIPAFVESERFDLDFRLKQYEEYMSR
jgi:hypothetical protein